MDPISRDALALRFAQIASDAGAVIMASPRTATSKADGSPVTAADRDAETLIRARLRELDPALPIIAEESFDATASHDLAERFLLVDPLDGTRDFVAGGDEFTVLLDPLQNVKGALEVAERIRTALSGPRCIDGQELTLGVSVGVATSRDAECANELLRRADEAMYAAKRNGRARVEVVDNHRSQQVSSLAHFLV